MNLSELKRQQKLFYRSIVSIYSPALNENVHFTSDGFHHLVYKSNRKPRTISEQWLKLKCLQYVPRVVKNCKYITDTRIYTNKKTGKTIIYYELRYKINAKNRIQVIVERKGNGKLKFKSVMKIRKNQLKR